MKKIFYPLLLLFFLTLCSFANPVFSDEPLLSKNDAFIDNDGRCLVSFDVKNTNDLLKVKNDIESIGGAVISLTPEETIIAAIPVDKIDIAKQIKSVNKCQVVKKVIDSVKDTGKDEPKGLGDVLPTAEEKERLDKKTIKTESVERNDLSIKRGLLQGRDSLPTQVDNSLSQYFPPIRSQGGLGACTTWASCYYYNTYTQSMDEGINASNGNNSDLCSPAFMYALINGGSDTGGGTQSVMDYINDVGCCSWSTMPYDGIDYTTWPTETAWVEALKNRTSEGYMIGGYSGCSDSDLTAMKTRLSNGYVGTTRTNVYSNWYNNYPSNVTGINNGVLFANDGSNVGGHALTIVGYDDNKSYYDGISTRYGAFLIANSWGSSWGVTNTGGSKKGFMWVAYDFFKSTSSCFGMMFYNTDIDNYRSKMYAIAGLNHSQRGYLVYSGGVGTTSSPSWLAPDVLYYSGGTSLAVNDSKRIVVDLNDGISSISNFSAIKLFVNLAVSSSASSNGTITSADFKTDFDGDGTFVTVSSSDPTVTVTPGNEGYATALFAADFLMVTPGTGYTPAGPEGGDFTPSSKDYTISNIGTSSFDWSATHTASWADISKTAGTLAGGASDTITVSVKPSANSLAAGTYTGTLTLKNIATGLEQTRDLSLTVRPLAKFGWNTIGTQSVLFPFEISIAAQDSLGETIKTFNGTVNISANTSVVHSIGTGTATWQYPLYTYYHDSRTQVIYLASEIGASGQISSLALNVTSIPGQRMNNWTIRMKHTTLSNYSTAQAWETNWTTVYQNNEDISVAGWYTFNFSTPFIYNGTDNLMIDFSINNESWTSPGEVTATSFGTSRSLYYNTDSYYGDPLTWSGVTNPTPYTSGYVPNLKMTFASTLSTSPTLSGNFTNGVWNGNVQVLEVASGVFMSADDGSGHTGNSNTFDVLAGYTPTPSPTPTPSATPTPTPTPGASPVPKLYNEPFDSQNNWACWLGYSEASSAYGDWSGGRLRCKFPTTSDWPSPGWTQWLKWNSGHTGIEYMLPMNLSNLYVLKVRMSSNKDIDIPGIRVRVANSNNAWFAECNYEYYPGVPAPTGGFPTTTPKDFYVLWQPQGSTSDAYIAFDTWRKSWTGEVYVEDVSVYSIPLSSVSTLAYEKSLTSFTTAAGWSTGGTQGITLNGTAQFSDLSYTGYNAILYHNIGSFVRLANPITAGSIYKISYSWSKLQSAKTDDIRMRANDILNGAANSEFIFVDQDAVLNNIPLSAPQQYHLYHYATNGRHPDYGDLAIWADGIANAQSGNTATRVLSDIEIIKIQIPALE